jgi:hypothetical protein
VTWVLATGCNDLQEVRAMVVTIDERVLAGRLVRQGTLFDWSGMIAVGGTAEEALPANDGRRYLLIQNPSSNGSALWVAFGQPSIQASPSVELLPGATLVFEAGFVPTEGVWVVASIANLAYTMWEG